LSSSFFRNCTRRSFFIVASFLVTIAAENATRRRR
jgi:hypothetical protein